MRETHGGAKVFGRQKVLTVQCVCVYVRVCVCLRNARGVKVFGRQKVLPVQCMFVFVCVGETNVVSKCVGVRKLSTYIVCVCVCVRVRVCWQNSRGAGVVGRQEVLAGRFRRRRGALLVERDLHGGDGGFQGAELLADRLTYCGGAGGRVGAGARRVVRVRLKKTAGHKLTQIHIHTHTRLRVVRVRAENTAGHELTHTLLHTHTHNR